VAHTSVYQRTLIRALGIVRSRKALARALRVPESALEGWLAGRESPPKWAFLAAVDIVVEASEPPSLSSPRRSRAPAWEPSLQ
jgi:hypothetical protein